jgi:hypothetical protein
VNDAAISGSHEKRTRKPARVAEIRIGISRARQAAGVRSRNVQTNRGLPGKLLDHLKTLQYKSRIGIRPEAGRIGNPLQIYNLPHTKPNTGDKIAGGTNPAQTAKKKISLTSGVRAGAVCRHHRRHRRGVHRHRRRRSDFHRHRRRGEVRGDGLRLPSRSVRPIRRRSTPSWPYPHRHSPAFRQTRNREPDLYPCL